MSLRSRLQIEALSNYTAIPKFSHLKLALHLYAWVNVKEYIDDSIVQYNVHVGDKIGTMVKDSVVQRSNIGAARRSALTVGLRCRGM